MRNVFLVAIAAGILTKIFCRFNNHGYAKAKLRGYKYNACQYLKSSIGEGFIVGLN